MAIATLAGGCFWCTETLFARLDGVQDVISGYTDGHIKNPAYREVCTGRTGHAECIQLEYNPEKISFVSLLEVFFDTHNPTTLNRQGADVGTQYRSGIYYHYETQKVAAETLIDDLTKEKKFKINPEMMNLLGCSKENFYKLMTYMNYKKDKAVDTYIFKGEKKKKEKIIRFDKKENPFNKLLTLNIK